ncbi:MAG TPA: cytochrome c biogenesis heme-transporting ATPase CcmA [Burkholderiales bacterium]|nr:cytochrome c biogenesis heme-transporting ATPase CcmA [Burkholderiales bacterium]
MLEAADLRCERGGKTLFQNLSLQVSQGELLRIAGANGSGKTSLLRILCGLALPAHGEVRWKGVAIRRLGEEYSRSLVHIGHASGLKDELTAAENLAITCTLAGVSVSGSAVRDALGRFTIPAEKQIKYLSQGQRRRAALARLALSGEVPLWLLDEPLAALDSAASSLAEELIRAHAGRGGAVVYTTHQDGGLRETRVIEL